MGRIYVAVDLETTGLNPERDAILELGAVRFRDGEILETFSQVVNPGRPIPRKIQQLTGISQAEADRAPDVGRVAAAFRRFIGDHPLVGHNVGFDVDFLNANNLYRFNPTIDTWEMALILLPGLPSYKLGRIADHLEVELRNAHRAFDDAQASMHVFEALLRRAADLPAETLRQINLLAERSDWRLRDVFVDAEREALHHWGDARPARVKAAQSLSLGRPAPLEPLEHPQPLNIPALAALLEPEGAFARTFAHYEHRQPQVEMLKAVAGAFNQSQQILIEAGTGTGKSVAYLIPALAWAVQTGKRVVVSSNTINLQDQLRYKDLPDLQQTLPFPFKAAVMKGRSNYLCPRRLKALLQRSDLTTVEISVLARVLVWLPTTQTGDQGEITLANTRERAVWQRICSDSLSCSPSRCTDSSGQPCFFYRARFEAEAAHVVIVNHALLLADIATENRVLPAYQHLIIDEAHHMEDAATNALALSVDYDNFIAHLRDLAPTSTENRAVGLLSNLATAVRSACPADKSEKLIGFTRELAEAIPLLDVRTSEWFHQLERFLLWQSGQRKYEGGSYDLKLRLTDAERVQPMWADVEIVADNLSIPFKKFIANLDRLVNAFADLGNYPIANREDLEADLQSALRALTEIQHLLETAVFKPDANTIYWLRRSQNGSVLEINSAPLHVGSLIERYLFQTKDTIVLTSATLRTANSFAYLRDRLSIDDAIERVLESPFDYRTHALVYLPTDMPEPNDAAYQSKVEEAILHLSLAMEGRLMALFTSYAQLQRTAEALRAALEEAGMTLFVQGEGGSRQQLLEAFRQTGRAVIMGTRSFWEGVDVQGDALSALVICRLPFAVPSDPITAARSETFDSPFYQYSVPEAILSLRQGFGRLIRSASDRGVCAILDRRVLSKSYGKLFLESLPDCSTQRGPLANLPITARRWLAGEAPQPAPVSTRANSRPAPVPDFLDWDPTSLPPPSDDSWG